MSNTSPPQDNDARGQTDGAQDRKRASAEQTDETLAEQIAEIADVVAELHVAAAARDAAAQAARRQLRPFEVVMIVLLAISLLIHALTISRLLAVRNTLRDEVSQLAGAVQAAKRNSVRYDLPIDQQLPIDIDVPIKRTLDVPINTQVRIQQNIVVPVDTGLGTVNIPVPLDTTIPISLTVPIELDQTVNISTTVPIKLNVPIQVDMGSSPFAGYLDQLYQALLAMRERL